MLVVAGDLLLILTVLLAVLLYRANRKRRSDQDQAVRFVQKLKTYESERRADLRQMLKETYRLDEHQLADNADALLSLEKSLYSRFLRIFLGKSPGALGTLDESVRSLLDGYRKLVPADRQDSPEQKAMERENEELRLKAHALAAELQETRAAMDQILAEYTSMYGGNHAEAMKKRGEQAGRKE
jgi:hypothetical protein